jgi:hypothetical protein
MRGRPRRFGKFAVENGFAVKEVFRDAFTGTEADTLRRKRSGQRMSFAKIAEELNNRQISTRTGAIWQTTTVVNILKRRPLSSATA